MRYDAFDKKTGLPVLDVTHDDFIRYVYLPKYFFNQLKESIELSDKYYYLDELTGSSYAVLPSRTIKPKDKLFKTFEEYEDFLSQPYEGKY
jgi:hypothetical protein